MIDLKNRQHKQNGMTKRIEKLFGLETHLFRLLLHLGLPFFLDGFCRFLFNIFSGISGFCHHLPLFELMNI